MRFQLKIGIPTLVKVQLFLSRHSIHIRQRVVSFHVKFCFYATQIILPNKKIHKLLWSNKCYTTFINLVLIHQDYVPSVKIIIPHKVLLLCHPTQIILPNKNTHKLLWSNKCYSTFINLVLIHQDYVPFVKIINSENPSQRESTAYNCQ